MKCYNCNAVIADNASFCPKCGKPQSITPQLLNAALKGDQSALTDLYNKTYNSVYNTVRFLVKDEDTVLDILQDSYIKAFNSLDQLQNANKFEPWVKRIAHNKAIDYLRAAKPVSFSSLESDESGSPVEFEDDRPDHLPEAVIDRNETTRLINEILDSLPEDQRACISLFYYDQLSVKEIAEELNVSEATVKSRLNYGRKKIETQVRALEKKGTKLYGLAPIPFLMLLFHTEAQAAELPSSVVLQSVLSASASQTLSAEAAGQAAGAKAVTTKAAGSGVKAAGSGAKAAASGAKAAGSAAAKNIAVQAAAHTAKAAVAPKIIAVIAAVAVAAGGGTAAVRHIQQTRQETAIVSEESEAGSASAEVQLPERPEIPEPPADIPEPQQEEVSEPQEEVPEATSVPEEASQAKPASVSLIEIEERYTALLAREPEDFLSNYESGIVNDIDNDLVAEHFRTGETVYAGYTDYNNDGILELVLALGDESDKYARAIYFVDGENLSYVCITEELGNRANLYVLTGNRLMLHAGSSATSGSDIVFFLSENESGPSHYIEYVYDEQQFGTMDHSGGNMSYTDEHFQAEFWDGAVEAAHYGDIEFSALPSFLSAQS